MEVLTVGYNSISRKYIRPISVADFAFEGLRGFPASIPCWPSSGLRNA